MCDTGNRCTQISPREITTENETPSVDVFHMYRLKDGFVRNRDCSVKYQLRHSFHHHHVKSKEDDDWQRSEFQIMRFLFFVVVS